MKWIHLHFWNDTCETFLEAGHIGTNQCYDVKIPVKHRWFSLISVQKIHIKFFLSRNKRELPVPCFNLYLRKFEVLNHCYYFDFCTGFSHWSCWFNIIYGWLHNIHSVEQIITILGSLQTTGWFKWPLPDVQSYVTSSPSRLRWFRQVLMNGFCLKQERCRSIIHTRSRPMHVKV